MTNNILTKTELEIMNFFWDTDHEITASDIRKHFSNKDWSKQTISTFLKKLVNLGYLKRHKVSVTKFFYTVNITKEEHELLPAKDVLNNVYGGSYGDFVCALMPSNTDKKEIDKLKQILSDFIERNVGNASE